MEVDNLGPVRVVVVINGLTREDGSGEKWLFEGYLPNNQIRNQKVDGYFNLLTRTGWIRFVY